MVVLYKLQLINILMVFFNNRYDEKLWEGLTQDGNHFLACRVQNKIWVFVSLSVVLDTFSLHTPSLYCNTESQIETVKQ